jgi:uncharacterized repeat protein (TIGR03837 family)
MPLPRSWDVFCRVVDNFGDAAVCWRLARSLAALSPSVRLWIDQPEVLRALLPALAPGPRPSHESVEVRHWTPDADFGAPAEVAVDAFGGGLPPTYAGAMAARGRGLWIVLEYLSAEPWVTGHHGLPSPHPSLAVERYFFFPGFVPGTGGLLREADLDARRAAFLAEPARREALWREAGFDAPRGRVATLFGYENAALAELLTAWAAGPEPIVAAVPQSRLASGVARFAGSATPGAGTALRTGALEMRFLPFLPQDRYDELLWTADWNFVRGEDSFVRAQWAERPFAWQIYPQADDAHLAKLDAFLRLYSAGLDTRLAAALGRFSRAWNAAPDARPGDIARNWAALSDAGDVLAPHARAWAARIEGAGDLAMNLARFCSERLN